MSMLENDSSCKHEGIVLQRNPWALVWFYDLQYEKAEQGTKKKPWQKKLKKKNRRAELHFLTEPLLPFHFTEWASFTQHWKQEQGFALHELYISTLSRQKQKMAPQSCPQHLMTWSMTKPISLLQPLSKSHELLLKISAKMAAQTTQSPLSR